MDRILKDEELEIFMDEEWIILKKNNSRTNL